MRGADTSASLRKSHLLMLARCWGYQSNLWVPKQSRKRVPLQPEPMPPPLAPRRSESRAAAAAARAAAEEARRAAAYHLPGSAFPQLAFPCVASAITAALADAPSGGGGGAMQPCETGRYSSTLSDGAAAALLGAGGGVPPSNRSSTTSVALPSDVDSGVRAWLSIDAAPPGSAAAEAEAAVRAWRERAAAHAAAAAPQHAPVPLPWGAAPPIEQWLAQHVSAGGMHPHQQAPSAAVEALAAAMERGEEYVDDPMTWGY